MIEAHQMTSLAFAGIIFLLTVFDKQRLNTVLTPFSLSAWPLVVIILIVNFLLGGLEFKFVTVRAQLFLLSNVLVIWLIGLIFLYNSKVEDRKNISDVFQSYVRYQYVLITLSWIVNIAVFLRVRSLLASNGGFAYLGDPEYEDLITSGPVAHLAQFGKVTFIFLCLILPHISKKKLIYFTLFGLVLSFVALQVKYNLISVLVIAFIYHNYSLSVRKQLTNIMIFSLLVVLLMGLFLVLLTVFWGTYFGSKTSVWLFVLRNMLSYLFSAPIVLDEWLSHPGVQPDWTLLIIFRNILNIINGNPILYNPLNYVDLDFTEVAPMVFSNVGTGWGSYYIIGGWLFSLFMSGLVSIISYHFFFLCARKNTSISIFFNLIFLSLATLSFFGQYFTLISYYEMCVMFIVLLGILNLYNMLNRNV